MRSLIRALQYVGIALLLGPLVICGALCILLGLIEER
jgi:hypothetical protein